VTGTVEEQMKSKRGTHFGPLPKADVNAVLEAVAVGALPPSTSRWRSGLPTLKEDRVPEHHPLAGEGKAGTGGGDGEDGADGADGDAALLSGKKKITKAEAKALRQAKAQGGKRDKPSGWG
jgi:hypothetical protein